MELYQFLRKIGQDLLKEPMCHLSEIEQIKKLKEKSFLFYVSRFLYFELYKGTLRFNIWAFISVGIDN